MTRLSDAKLRQMFASYTDPMLAIAWANVDNDRVKSGPRKGQITIRAMKWSDLIHREQVRRRYEAAKQAGIEWAQDHPEATMDDVERAGRRYQMDEGCSDETLTLWTGGVYATICPIDTGSTTTTTEENEMTETIEAPAQDEAGFQDRETTTRFALAGKATLTLVSKATGVRFTYQVKAKVEDDVKSETFFFVSLLTGPDNLNDYRYLGILTGGPGQAWKFRTTLKSVAGPNASSAKAFDYFTNHVLGRQGPLPSGLEVYHDGRCGHCHRTLTDPASIRRGIGPICAGYGA